MMWHSAFPFAAVELVQKALRCPNEWLGTAHLYLDIKLKLLPDAASSRSVVYKTHHIYIYIYTYIHTYIHTYTHTHMFIHIL